MQEEFDRLWGKSFPDGKSQEFGGTIVKDINSGEYSIMNTQGGESGTFSPNLAVPEDKKVVGIFHTHPYDESEGGYVDVSLSGADIAYVLNTDSEIIIAQSGESQFMAVKTGESKLVDFQKFQENFSNSIAEHTKSGNGWKKSVRKMAMSKCAEQGLAYYEGIGGKFIKLDY